ncbi:hypothetical protein [Variovorax paradoxus]|uniref:hypothetical protein n=1 Tax=Variovorax paradoxus TaxID=34073 RepID=UPI001933BFCD|nr:hypothetical protein INQ48_20655 [Variovorax paradoxus]
MSRSGYIDDGDCDDVLAMGRWQGQIASAIRGTRGQAALRELAAAMDAMPAKVLAAESLVTADGELCTLGVLGQARGLDMAPIDPDDWDAVAKAFNLAPAMVREIVYENDEGVSAYDWVDVEICGPIRRWERHRVTVRVDRPWELVARMRWNRMRKWVDDHLAKARPTPGEGA